MALAYINYGNMYAVGEGLDPPFKNPRDFCHPERRAQPVAEGSVSPTSLRGAQRRGNLLVLPGDMKKCDKREPSVYMTDGFYLYDLDSLVNPIR